MKAVERNLDGLFLFGCECVERTLLSAAFDFAFGGASASVAENGCDHTGIATAVQHRDHSEGLLFWRINDHKLAHGLKSQRLRSEVGTAVTNVRKRHNRLDRFVDFFTD